jgi:hypothetical protein
MSYYQYGNSTVNFGVPTLTAYGVIAKDSTVDQVPNINAVVENETGSIVVRRMDDNITTFNFTGYTNNGTGSFGLFPGALTVISSSIFTGDAVCEKVTVQYKNKSFTEFSATLVNNAHINYAITGSID